MRPLLMVPRGVLLVGLFSLAALWPTAMEAQLWPASLRGAESAGEQQAAAQEKQESGDKKQPDKPAPPKPEYPKFADVTKEHKQILGQEGKPGFFPLYYHEKKDQLLGVVPRGMIGQNFLLATSISGGPNFAGYMWEHRVVNWVEMDKKLVLIEPELRYVKPQGKTPIKDVIDRTYTDRILLSTPIITKRGADPVIDLGSIFTFPKRIHIGPRRVVWDLGEVRACMRQRLAEGE